MFCAANMRQKHLVVLINYLPEVISGGVVLFLGIIRPMKGPRRRCSLPSPMPLGGGRWLHRGQVVHWLLGDDALGRRDLLEGGAVGLCERGHAAAHACRFAA